MPDNKNRKHLIIVEIERTGFIVAIKTKYREATKIVDKLTQELDVFGWDEQEMIREFLFLRGYTMYTINGNMLYSGRSIYFSSNGRLSIMAIPIKFSSMCVDMFIRERENSSVLCPYDACRHNLFKKYFEDSDLPLILAN